MQPIRNFNVWGGTQWSWKAANTELSTRARTQWSCQRSLKTFEDFDFKSFLTGEGMGRYCTRSKLQTLTDRQEYPSAPMTVLSWTHAIQEAPQGQRGRKPSRSSASHNQGISICPGCQFGKATCCQKRHHCSNKNNRSREGPSAQTWIGCIHGHDELYKCCFST